MVIWKKINSSYKNILKNNIKYFLALISLLVISSFFTIYPTKLIGEIINSLKNGGDISKTTTLIYIYIATRIINVCMNISSKYLQEYTKTKIEYELRTKAVLTLFGISMADFKSMQSTQVVTRIFTAVEQLVSALLSVVTWVGKSVTSLIFTFYFLFKIDVEITLMFIPLLFIMAFTTKYIAKKKKYFVQKEAEKSSEVKDFIQELMYGFREIKSYDAVDWAYEKYKNKEKCWKKYRIKNSMFASTLFWLLNSFGIIVVSMILFIGSKKAISGQLMSGDLTSLILYSGTVFMTVMEVFDKVIVFQTLGVAIDRFNEVMDKTNSKSKKRINKLENYDIEIKEAYFSYDGKNDALKNINLKIPFNRSVAIIGESGSGKSTLAKLIIGEYVLNSGVIKIGAHDIKDISEKELKDKITLAHQDAFMFTTSILENITLGKKVENEEVEKAAIQSNSKEFIDSLKNKFDEEIKENGSNLSGGQKQRIGLARGLIRNSKIIILDEISASLDAVSESKIINNLKERNNQTIINISHKANVIKAANFVVVMNKGEILDSGTNEELLERCEQYRKIISESKGKEINSNKVS